MVISIKEKTAVGIVRKLRASGFDAYFVGGSVRDMRMGKTPKDYDILTDAKPVLIKKLFKKTIPVGEKFGVIIVVENGVNFEVATARIDKAYRDLRHPEAVEFTDIMTDIYRRDFTVNSLLYDPVKKKYVDLAEGEKDIKRKLIRTVGDPDKRFSEDALRLLRAIRFSAKLGFRIEPATLASISKNRNKIKKISAERIKDELVKMIESGNFLAALKTLDETGLLKILLPEVEKLKGVEQPKAFHPEGDVYKHTLLTIKHLTNKTDPVTVLAALFHDIGKPKTFKREERIKFYGHDMAGAKITEKILRRLKFQNEVTDKVKEIVANHMYFMEVKKMRLAKVKRLVMRPTFDAELDLHRADCLASHSDISNYRFLLKKKEEFSKLPLVVPKIITGKDLIALGYQPGPIFKEILTEVQNAFLENRLKSKPAGLEFIKKKFPLIR